MFPDDTVLVREFGIVCERKLKVNFSNSKVIMMCGNSQENAVNVNIGIRRMKRSKHIGTVLRGR